MMKDLSKRFEHFAGRDLAESVNTPEQLAAADFPFELLSHR